MRRVWQPMPGYPSDQDEDRPSQPFGSLHRSLQMAAMDMERLTKAPRLISSTGRARGYHSLRFVGDMLITYKRIKLCSTSSATKEQFTERLVSLRIIIASDDRYLYKKSVEMIETDGRAVLPIVSSIWRRLRRTRAVSAMQSSGHRRASSPRHVHRSGRSRALSADGRRRGNR